MPGGDRTGPVGYGPMTGRAAGYCAGYGVPGYMNPIPGFGRGMGFGRGRGFGRGFGRGWGIGFGRGRDFRNWARMTGMPGWQKAAVGMPAFGMGWRAYAIQQPQAIPQAWIGQAGYALPYWQDSYTQQIPAIQQPLQVVIQPQLAPQQVPQLTNEQEMQLLEDEIKAIEQEKRDLLEEQRALEGELGEMRKRIAELQTK